MYGHLPVWGGEGEGRQSAVQFFAEADVDDDLDAPTVSLCFSASDGGSAAVTS